MSEMSRDAALRRHLHEPSSVTRSFEGRAVPERRSEEMIAVSEMIAFLDGNEAHDPQ